MEVFEAEVIGRLCGGGRGGAAALIIDGEPDQTI